MSTLITQVKKAKLFGRPMFEMSSDQYWTLLLLSSMMLSTLVIIATPHAL